MKFDIKDVKSWANRKDVKIGAEGYFCHDINKLRNNKNEYIKPVKSKLSAIRDNYATCFQIDNGRDGDNVFPFFLPLDAVKKDKTEKKYRPLQSIDEMDCLFNHSVMNANSFITYRSKVTGEIYVELLFAVCRDKNNVLSSINNIPVQDLFDNFEIRKNGKWCLLELR